MAMPPVLFNRTSLDQQLNEAFARIDAKFQTANFCLSVSKYSGLLAIVCIVGAMVTEPENGKKRSLSNKILLGVSAVGVVASFGFAVASFASTFFTLRSSNNF